MSNNKLAPSEEAFNEWRNGVVGEWFFGQVIDKMKANIQAEWAASINAMPDKLTAIQLSCRTQILHLDTIQGATHDGLLFDLDQEAQSED